MISGTIISHPNFRFHDGGISNKILISLGISSGTTILVKTTSKGYRYMPTFGCQCEHRFPFFHLVQNSCCLALPTWVCLNEFYEFKADALEAKRIAGDFHQIGTLCGDLTRSLVECAIQSDGITGHQERILKAANGI